MVSPLNNAGSQNLNAINPYQKNNQQQTQALQNQQQKTAQAEKTNQTSAANTENQGSQQLVRQASAEQPNPSGNQGRGSIIDISV